MKTTMNTRTRAIRMGLLAVAGLGLGFLLGILAIYVLGIVGPKLPISIWDGQGEIVAWYEMDGHHVFHVRLAGNTQLTAMQVVEMIEVGLDLAGDSITPEHGLYMIVENVGQEILAFAVGLTYDAIAAWPETITEANIPYDLVNYIDWRVFGFNLRWPSWVADERVKVFGYAWLVGVEYRETHPWYPELYYSKPGPLDSDFMIEPEDSG